MSDGLGFPGFSGAIIAIFGIWSLVGVAVYVWYLWALARLFPLIGLPAVHGWIPVWNQWRLIERAGLPGWTAIFSVIPGLSIITYVMSILTMHRINREHGETTGMTVLGALLPPLWATLLGSRVQDGGYGAVPGGAGLVEYGADGQVYPLLQPTQQVSAPTQGSFTMPPVPGLRPAAPGSEEPQVRPSAPASSIEHQAPIAPDSDEAAAPAVPAVPAMPGAVSPGIAAPAPLPQNNPWGFGKTTEGNFLRLAGEELPARETSFGNGQDLRPFSWPQPAPAAAPAPAVQPVPVAQPAPVAQSAPVAEEPEPTAAPEQVAAPDHVTAPDHVAAPDPLVTAEPEPARESQPEPVVVPVPVAIPAVAPVQDAEVVAPVRPAPKVVSTPVARPAPATDTSPVDDDFDRTVVVSRRTHWVLELPDGQTHELLSDDIVLGRKPVAVDESDVLVVHDATRTLSKSHARLRRAGDVWTVEDLQSTNGVFVYDAFGQQTELTPGEQVEIVEYLTIGTLEARLRISE
ncbi:FHA domain-containing protein [Leucobacter sp. G161]|uniref:FHA domain-containing protein n=1 Tax=Leucobacter sp. G161 TaxID=663704 RepID=UPI00073B0310|nr:FHA domain-containing protein [Leucobacter sp. G161]KUF07883.1 hypothetical protein AUL38_01030 [Leucobacter sp. G161]